MSNASLSNEDFDSFDMQNVAEKDRYKLFMGAIVPRPIAFVSTLASDGTVNAAPISSFMSLSAINNLIAISINEPEAGGVKDTLRNIRERGEFTINTVDEAMAAQVQICSAYYPPDVSEVEVAGLHILPSQEISTPRITESPVHFECRLHSLIPFETAVLVAGRVVAMHIRRGLEDNFKITINSYKPLGRLAGRSYCKIGEIVDV